MQLHSILPFHPHLINILASLGQVTDYLRLQGLFEDWQTTRLGTVLEALEFIVISDHYALVGVELEEERGGEVWDFLRTKMETG
jgi:hypothetical protein